MRASIQFAAILALVSLAGCRGQTTKDSPLFGIRNMYDQPKYDIQRENDFFDDHRDMRPPVEGVISREQEIDLTVAEGRLEDNTGWALTIPARVIHDAGGMEALVNRGQDRYNIYCTPCHDKTGSGNGMIRQHALATGAAAFAPPSFHQDRIRHMPDGQLFATISNGKNNMPSYGGRIPVSDRWAIVSYVRALQLSQAPLQKPEQKP